MSASRPVTGRLRADCTACAGLCCVVPAFAASADFAIDKPAGQPCPQLRADHRCGIHARLRERGFRGCAVFDCFGAGQRVTGAVAEPARRFAGFPVVLRLHELLWHLDAALALPATRPLHARLRAAFTETDRLAGSPDAWPALDLTAHHERVTALLRQASELARALPAGPRAEPAGGGRTSADHAGADLTGRDLAGRDLAGRDLRGTELRRASLRGALLIAADLRGVDLAFADLTGADLRDADLSAADLSRALFVTQPQLDAARGDRSTRVPAGLVRPAHWRQTRASRVSTAAMSAASRQRPRKAQ